MNEIQLDKKHLKKKYLQPDVFRVILIWIQKVKIKFIKVTCSKYWYNCLAYYFLNWFLGLKYDIDWFWYDFSMILAYFWLSGSVSWNWFSDWIRFLIQNSSFNLWRRHTNSQKNRQFRLFYLFLSISVSVFQSFNLYVLLCVFLSLSIFLIQWISLNLTEA